MRHGAMDPGPGARMRALSTALRLRHVGVQHHRLDLICDFSENLPTAWPAREPVGFTDAELYSEEMAGTLAAMRSSVLSDRLGRTIELARPDNGRQRVFEVSVSPDIDADDHLVGLITTIADVTEERERENAIANLLREVSHRSKNLLAIAQSIAMQTGAHSQNMDDFLRKFRGRLQALAGTQDLVTDTNWRGALLSDLVSGQLVRLGLPKAASVVVSGDDPMLGPNAALHVGLALHELATNAVLYGALAYDPPSRIEIGAVLLPAPGEPEALRFTWQEAPSGHEAETPKRKPRFGTLILERIVPDAVGGKAELDISPHGVRYELTVPAGQFAS
jgi:two-component sensor histidine kinase